MIKDRIKDKTKLIDIPNFIDTELYYPEDKENDFSKKLGLNNYFVIGYAGNIGAYQDWEIVVKAAGMLKDDKVRFLIVGEGAKKDWLHMKIKENKLNNILMMDYQPREIIPLINASADIHMITMTETSDMTGLPSKIFAIMASRRSFIAATGTNSAITRIMREAQCGRRVDIGDYTGYVDEVRSMMQHKAELLTEGSNGRCFVEKNIANKS